VPLQPSHPPAPVTSHHHAPRTPAGCREATHPRAFPGVPWAGHNDSPMITRTSCAGRLLHVAESCSNLLLIPPWPPLEFWMEMHGVGTHDG